MVEQECNLTERCIFLEEQAGLLFRGLSSEHEQVQLNVIFSILTWKLFWGSIIPTIIITEKGNKLKLIKSLLLKVKSLMKVYDRFL